MKKLIALLFLSTVSAFAQPSNPSIVLVSTAPSGSCSVNLPDQQVITTGALYSCQNGTWAKFGTGSGSGSVTSVTFTGDGTVLSATPSGAVTTSGTLTAALAAASANTFLAGPSSGGAVAPTYRAVNLANADVTGVLPLANGGLGNLQTPAWLRFFGDGSEGALTVTSGTTTITGEHWYSSISVSGGAILANGSTGGTTPLILRATGTCTITGTLSVSTNTGGVGQAGAGYGGGTGGGGGGGTGAGTAATGMNGITNGGTAGNSSGGGGGNGNTFGSTMVKWLYSGEMTFAQAGASTILLGGTLGGAGGTGSAAGGKAGSFVALICQTINFTGTIDASGTNGAASAGNNNGSGGGGGGGLVITAAETYTANTGTISLGGGSGGTCGAFTNCGVGGTGGTGNSKQFTIQ